jgi:spore coat polysaccharide biosynthesis protein SpsF
MGTKPETLWRSEHYKKWAARTDERRALLIRSNYALFYGILEDIQDEVESILEFGAGNGLNLLAIRDAFPDIDLHATDINPEAVKELDRLGFPTSCYSVTQRGMLPQDMVLTKGVLMHVPPDQLPAAYQVLYETARKYILICEYYNPVPVEVPYHGETGVLWKRDYAGEMLDIYPDLRLVDYGFVYHRDPVSPLDDVSWFLLQKGGVLDEQRG